MDQPEKRPRGRPQMPDSIVIHTRIDNDLLERLARYIDREASFGRTELNRAYVLRMLLDEFLEREGYLSPLRELQCLQWLTLEHAKKGHEKGDRFIFVFLIYFCIFASRNGTDSVSRSNTSTSSRSANAPQSQ